MGVESEGVVGPVLYLEIISYYVARKEGFLANKRGLRRRIIIIVVCRVICDTTNLTHN